MHPNLFAPIFERLGLDSVHAYVVLQWVSIVLSLVALALVAPGFQLSRARLVLTGLVCFFIAGITSKLTFFFTASGPSGLLGAMGERSAWTFIVEELVTPWRGGQVYYGGVVGALLGVCLVCPLIFGRSWRWALPRVLDGTMFATLIVSALGRVGCYCAGCCFGEVNATYGVSFPPFSAAAMELTTKGLIERPWESTPPLLPVQLIEATTSTLILAFLTARLFRPRAPGSFLKWGLVLYGVERFTIEFWRFDVRGHAGPFSTSQWVAVTLVTGVLVFQVTRLVLQRLKQNPLPSLADEAR